MHYNHSINERTSLFKIQLAIYLILPQKTSIFLLDILSSITSLHIILSILLVHLKWKISNFVLNLCLSMSNSHSSITVNWLVWPYWSEMSTVDQFHLQFRCFESFILWLAFLIISLMLNSSCKSNLISILFKPFSCI